MRHLLIITFLILFTGGFQLFGQKPFKEYLDKNEIKTDSTEKAIYYREGNRNEEGKLEGAIKVYYKNGVLRNITQYKNGKREGEYMEFYSNERIAEKANYRDNTLEGKFETWYVNGQKQEEGEWAERQGYKIISFWDSTGKQTLTNGTGEVVKYKSNHAIDYWETYRKGNLIKGKSYDEAGKEYLYDGTTNEQMPEFPGGISALGQYLSANLMYPQEARQKGVSGKVFVSFVVGSDGIVKDVQIPGRKLGYGIEEEAMRVVAAMPQWKPGIHRGRPVSIRYSLPINFGIHVAR